MHLFKLILSLLIILLSANIFNRMDTLNTVSGSIFLSSKTIVVNKNVVQINDICSGFIISGWENVILTASHCIRGTGKQLIEFYDHSEGQFTVIFNGGEAGTDKDFAILKGDTKGLQGFELTPRWPEHGEIIYHIGHSRGSKAQFYTPGLYDRHECTDHGCEHYVIAEIVPGDSGGALISEKDNKVFGIVHSSWWPRSIPYGIGTPIIRVIERMSIIRQACLEASASRDCI